VLFDALASDHPDVEEVVDVAQGLVALTPSLLKLTLLARELLRCVPREALDHLVGLLPALPILPGQFVGRHRPAVLGDQPLPAFFAGKAGIALDNLDRFTAGASALVEFLLTPRLHVDIAALKRAVGLQVFARLGDERFLIGQRLVLRAQPGAGDEGSESDEYR